MTQEGDMELYSEQFFRGHRNGSYDSAREVVPLLLNLVPVQRAIDVGCGTGTWLSVLKAQGIDILGIDGPWVTRDTLEIPPQCFVEHDLTQPFEREERADVVLSLEVAEHLPEECANQFVDTLVQFAPVVLFSAAIPHQGGTGHLNEQWPDYWAELFRDRGYEVVDCLRKRIWHNDKVEWWYAQNMLLFVDSAELGRRGQLKSEATEMAMSPLALVHPRLYLTKVCQVDSPRGTMSG